MKQENLEHKKEFVDTALSIRRREISWEQFDTKFDKAYLKLDLDQKKQEQLEKIRMCLKKIITGFLSTSKEVLTILDEETSEERLGNLIYSMNDYFDSISFENNLSYIHLSTEITAPKYHNTLKHFIFVLCFSFFVFLIGFYKLIHMIYLITLYLLSWSIFVLARILGEPERGQYRIDEKGRLGRKVLK